MRFRPTPASPAAACYLLSFLPEFDVNRIVDYAARTGKRSFAALVPDNAYGNVVEAAFKQAVGRRGGRVVAFEKYGADRSDAGADGGAIARLPPTRCCSPTTANPSWRPPMR